MTTITIPTNVAALAKAHDIDPERIALEAIADAIEQAVARAASEAENVARRTAIEAVADTIAPLRQAIGIDVPPVKAPIIDTPAKGRT